MTTRPAPSRRSAPSGHRTRRRPVAGRILAAGLSACTAVVLVGAMAGSGSGTRANRTDARVVVAAPRPGTDATAPSRTDGAPAVTRSDAPAVTTSQAS